MKKLLKEFSLPMYLGISLGGFSNINYANWQFYAIVIPTLLLYFWNIKIGK